ncbi:LysR family transcriptional regulator [Massilia sp. DWR3-1-1]|uniref:LysR family transcriptional regulator n=1 Tax=Massilia sp. DWR3-1-1 TaxID=2804559 RepID=UPI003CE68D16
MELRQLRYFIAVAEELHFTRAAARLHIGQPPLSHAIAMLEQDVGARLLERSKRWVRLTEAGRLFLVDARRIVALAEQARLTAQRAERGELGELRIGFTYSTPLTPLFAAAINAYRQAYPHVTLILQELATLRQLEGLEQRSIDLGFIRPPELPIPPTIRTTALREDPLVVVLPSRHRLAARSVLAIAELADESFVMYPQGAGTGIYPQIFRLCREAGFVPRITQTANESSTIIGLVAAGSGITLLPAAFERIGLEGVSYRPLSDKGAITMLYLAQREEAAAPLVAAFVDMLLQIQS